jgi:predicted nucleotide-binding protein (sugar kinase/HSP70/actin superfamily)
LRLKYDAKRLAVVLSEYFSSKLGISRKRIAEALDYGLSRQQRFIRDMHEQGRKILGHLDAQKPFVVVTGRPYNLYDERLNLRLGHHLAKIGVSAIPMDFIDVSTVDLSDFSSMYWGLGAQILRTAKWIKSRANFFGLHVTNFSCGADSFIEHFYKYVMGDKPYLILELDEHSAVAGVMTRIEAYQNVIHNVMDRSRSDVCGGLRLAN